MRYRSLHPGPCLVLGILLSAAVLGPVPARAQDTEEQFSRQLYGENDVSITDEPYTNALRYGWTRLGTNPASFEAARDLLPLWLWLLEETPVIEIAQQFPPFQPRDGTAPYWSWSPGGAVGQSLYTPADITEPDLLPEERPYAGWLYYSSSMQWTRHVPTGDSAAANNGSGPGSLPRSGYRPEQQHVIEALVGVVGPLSFAEEVQTAVHKQIGAPIPEGWDHQVRRAPALALRYLYRQILWDRRDEQLWGLDGDLSVRAGGTVGNVFNHVNGGMEGRIGRHIAGFTDEGIRPADTNLGGGRSRWEAYVFGRVRGRGVFSNVLIGGTDRHRVEPNPLMMELTLGGSLRYKWIKLAVQRISRSPEYDPGTGWHSYHSMSLTLLPQRLF